MTIAKSTFVAALQTARKRDGLTDRHVAQLLGRGRGEADAQWETIERSGFVETLLAHADKPFFEAFMLYVRAVAARLPDQERWVVDITLALGTGEFDAPLRA